MGTDQVLVFAVLLAVLVSFTVMGIEFIAPIITKSGFDHLCRDYMLIAEANNGLSSSHKKKFEEKLADIGVEQITVNVAGEGSVKRREILNFEVRAVFRYSGLHSLFERKAKEIKFNFRKSFLARIIEE